MGALVVLGGGVSANDCIDTNADANKANTKLVRRDMTQLTGRRLDDAEYKFSKTAQHCTALFCLEKINLF